VASEPATPVEAAFVSAGAVALTFAVCVVVLAIGCIRIRVCDRGISIRSRFAGKASEDKNRDHRGRTDFRR
jgi:hypothetical protein